MRGSYYHCRHPGCSTTAARTERIEVHEQTRHVRCQCGWVGVGFTKHVGQARRHRPLVDHHIVGVSTLTALQRALGPPDTGDRHLTEQLVVRVDAGLFGALQRDAFDHERTVAQSVRFHLRRALEPAT